MRYTFTTTKTVDTASIVISDDRARKTVTARLSGFPMPILLWTGQDYDAATYEASIVRPQID